MTAFTFLCGTTKNKTKYVLNTKLNATPHISQDNDPWDQEIQWSEPVTASTYSLERVSRPQQSDGEPRLNLEVILSWEDGARVWVYQNSSSFQAVY